MGKVEVVLKGWQDETSSDVADGISEERASLKSDCRGEVQIGVGWSHALARLLLLLRRGPTAGLDFCGEEQ